MSTSKNVGAVNVNATKKASAGEMPAWDTEWAAEKAADALRYLGRNYPECLENLRVLDQHETAAHEAAMRGDRDAYLEALRIRRGAA
jgi:hypothetical protein